jgi:hypothetical protein
VRTPQHDPVQEAGEDDVVGVAAGADQQAKVLYTADGLGKAELCHG